jgi:hypothetical protein
MGFRQFEWLVRERIRAGLQAFRDDTTLIDTLFEDLSENSRTNLKDWIVNNDIQVILGYPRAMPDIPCWSIAMAGETKLATPLGELFSHSFDAVAGETNEQGDIVQKNYQVSTVTQDPDLTLILATILGHILKSMRQDLALDGFYQMQVAQTDAENLQVNFLPNYLYIRTTMVSVVVEDSVLFIDTSLPRSTEITLAVNLSIPTT